MFCPSVTGKKRGLDSIDRLGIMAAEEKRSIGVGLEGGRGGGGG
jgi:hypothetical protein